ncbi:formylglycine-generating enzyme family protein [Myxococcota bacterium]|nr:formylglycine-generating enzyme family protein [Myxococcota bacterium]
MAPLRLTHDDVDALIAVLAPLDRAREPALRAALHHVLVAGEAEGFTLDQARLRARAVVVKGRDDAAFDEAWAAFAARLARQAEPAAPDARTEEGSGVTEAAARHATGPSGTASAATPAPRLRLLRRLLLGLAACALLAFEIWALGHPRPAPSEAGPPPSAPSTAAPSTEPASAPPAPADIPRGEPGETVLPSVSVTTAERPWALYLFGGLAIAAAAAIAWFAYRRRVLADVEATDPETPAPSTRPIALLPPSQRPARVHLDPRAEDTLVWGIGRFVSEDVSRRLDVAASVRATAWNAGVPEVVYARETYHREVHLWVDDATLAGQPELSALAAEVESTLARAGLPVERRGFWGVPEALVDAARRRLHPDELGEHRDAARVAILTDGRLWRDRLRDGETPALEAVRRALSHWPALAIFEPEGSAATRWPVSPGVPRLPVAHIVPWLAGETPRRAPSATTHDADLLRLRATLALAPAPPSVNDAIEIARTFGLRLTAAETLAAVADVRGADDRVRFGRDERTALLRWLFVQDSAREAARREWNRRLVIAGDTQHHRAARAVLTLTASNEPAALREAVRTLHALRDACAELIVSALVGLCPGGLGWRDTSGELAPPAADVVTLPWVWGEAGPLDFEHRSLLRPLWPASPHPGPVFPDERRVASGRGFVGAGLAGGAAVALLLSILSRATPPKLDETGERPAGAFVEAAGVGAWSVGRAPWPTATVKAADGEVARVDWARRSCTTTVDGLSAWLCGQRGDAVTPAAAVHVWLAAADTEPAARYLGMTLLDTGAATLIVFGDKAAPAAGSRLIIANGELENVPVGATVVDRAGDWPALARALRRPRGRASDLTELWSDARIRGPAFDLPPTGPDPTERLLRLVGVAVGEKALDWATQPVGQTRGLGGTLLWVGFRPERRQEAERLAAEFGVWDERDRALWLEAFLASLVAEEFDTVAAAEAKGFTCVDDARGMQYCVRVRGFDPLPETRFRPAMLPIRGGTFRMGAEESPTDRGSGYEPDDDETAHDATVSDFWMAETEVTQGQWKAVMGSAPSRFRACGDTCPVETVSWFDAVAYANALTTRDPDSRAACYTLQGCTGVPATGSYMCQDVRLDATCTGYRLPTEAEWEYAVRAGTRASTYAGPLYVKGPYDGPILDAIAWYGGNSEAWYNGAYDCADWTNKQYPSMKKCGPQPVRGKRPNSWGLYDMLGNVWEWTSDRHAGYPASALPDFAGPERGDVRVIRGGSWNVVARNVRAAVRFRWMPASRDRFVGFRVVLPAPRARP